jgi:hypothetical protein
VQDAQAIRKRWVEVYADSEALKIIEDAEKRPLGLAKTTHETAAW